MPLPVILQTITTLSIFIGLIVTMYQLQMSNKQRAREAALQMVHSFQTPEFLNAVDLVFHLPEGLSKAEIEAHVGDKMMSILVVFGTFESLGILVYRKDIDIRMVEDFFSGIIILSGKKLQRYVDEVRAAGKRETYYEWYQWLYELVERRERTAPAVPAYKAFKEWNG